MASHVERIRIGVCGTGFWADEVHLPVYAGSDRFMLAGVYGRRPESAAALAQKHGCEAFAGFDDMLERVDAVSFAVPPTVQAGLALRAIAAGKAVMLEKPAATSVADARRLVEAVETHGVAGMVYLPRLFVPDIVAVIDEARMRNATEGLASFRSGALLPGSPYAGSLWRQDDLGALWDIGPHALSVLMAALGEVASVRVANPRRALFECEFQHRSGARSAARLDLMDDTVDGFAERYTFGGDGGSIETGAFGNDRRGFFGRATDKFADLFAEGRADLGMGCDIVAVLEAASLAARDGQRHAVRRWDD